MKSTYIIFVISVLVNQSIAQSNCQYPLGTNYIFYPNSVQSIPNSTLSFTLAGPGNERFTNTISKGSFSIIYVSLENIGNTYSIGTCSNLSGIDDNSIEGSKISIFDYESGEIIIENTNISNGGVCVNYTPEKSGYIVILLTTSNCNSNSSATNKLVIKRSNPVIQPLNDNPDNATTLQITSCGATISHSIGNLKSATHTDLSAYGFVENYTNCNSNGNMPYFKSKDVWFKLNVGLNSTITLNISSESNWPFSDSPNYIRVFYSANGLNQFHLSDCISINNTTSSYRLVLSNLISNGVYFIAVSTNSESFGKSPIEFAISATTGNCSLCDSPIVNSPTINQGNTATLNASGCIGAVRWYEKAVDSTVIGIGNNFTTPTINSSGTYFYYAECFKSNCTTQVRSKSTVTVNSCNSSKVTLANIPSRNSAILKASYCSGTIKWYDQKTSGNLLHVGSTFSVSNLTNAGIYYYFAECSGTACFPAPRNIGLIIVEGNQPIVNSPTIRKGNTAALVVNNCVGSFVLWRKGNVDVQTTGYSYTTEVLNEVGVYNYSVYCKTNECSTTNVRGVAEVIVIGDCPDIINFIHPTNDFTSGVESILASSIDGNINATNWITNSGTKINYEAKSILLSPGFKVDIGAIFQAKTGGCSNE